MITQEEFKRRFHYNPETGLFTRLISNNGKHKAGGINSGGYIHIKIMGQMFKAHRLAFLYMNGEFPKNQVDHINGVPSDNRWVNLREATFSQNMHNSKSRRNDGMKGVFASRRRWGAQIQINKVRVYLGHFLTKEDAHAAYCEAAMEYHGEFARFK
jgi:hypothetical protein